MKAVRAAVPLLLVALLLVLAGFAASFSSLELGEVERDPPRLAPPSGGLELDGGGAPATAAPQQPEEDSGLSWLGDVLLVMWIAAGLVGLVLLLRLLARRRGVGSRVLQLRSLRRGQPVTGVDPGDQAPLLAALDAGLEELSDDDQDPRRAVIACWLRLEEAATAAGVPTYHADTAGDLVVRLLRAHQVSEPVLAVLADVYRRARYATHEVDEQMRTQARSALRRLRDELGVRV